MRKSRVESAIGQRMREAANKAGLGAEAIAERLNVSGTTIYRWWAGGRRPTDEAVRAYAEVVGATADDLLLGVVGTGPVTGTWQAMPATITNTFAAWVYRFAEAVMEGQPPGDALEQVSGQTVDADRRDGLNRRADQMRRYLAELAGRPWSELSPEERQQTVERLLKEVGE